MYAKTHIAHCTYNVCTHITQLYISNTTITANLPIPNRLFPADLKDHLSHDVLLMCVSCHQQATLHSDQLKRQLAEEYAAPLTSTSNARFQQDRKLLRVKNLAR